MAKRIPPHKIDEIFNAADIVDIISEFVQLKKKGSNYMGLSPWTNEKTPSFAVNPTKNIFKDFSSGRGGNAVSFLMELEGMTYVEALKWIAARYGIELELEETPEDTLRQDQRESLFVLNEFAAKWFHEQLLKTDEGRNIGLSYFRERGMIEATIQKFQLGWSPTSWDSFSKVAHSRQFREEFLLSTGLCFKSDKDGSLLDRFRERVMFPIHDHLGKVVGFGGRVLGADKKIAKYINSPESEIYHKSRVLYGLYFAKQAIRDKDQCILVEGYMDVISLAQAGVLNAVASSGTALTEEQIRLIKRFTNNVLLIYDADPAGINAALRGVDLMLEEGLNVRVLLLPQGDDPDSFVQKTGKSGFDDYVTQRAADFIDFKIDHLTGKKSLNDPQHKTQIIHEAAGTIVRIPDLVQQAVYMERAAERIGISQEVMNRAVQQATTARAKQDKRDRRSAETRVQETFGSPQETPTVRERLIQSDAQEQELLRIFLNYAESTLQTEGEDVLLGDYLVQELEGLSFDTPWLESFRQELFFQWEQHRRIDLNHFLNHTDTQVSAMSAHLLMIPYEVSINWEKFDIKTPRMDEKIDAAVVSATLHYKLKKIKTLLAQNRAKLKEAVENKQQEEETKLLKIQIRLNEIRQQLIQELGIVILE